MTLILPSTLKWASPSAGKGGSNTICRFISCLLLVTFCFTANAQPSKFAAIDRYSIRVPDSVPHTITAYTRYLVRKAPAPLLKVRAIYNWIANNISYDNDRYFSNNLDYNTEDSSMAEITFYTRRSVCSGYASLFNDMCKLAGVECVTISGYARGYSSQPNQPVREVNHDWNAVKINDQWELIDVTWGRDTISSTGLDEVWFMPEPINFAMSHYPEDAAWQLLEEPITQQFFNSLPHFYSWWFRLDFYGLSAVRPAVDANGRFEFMIKNDGRQELSASLAPMDEGGATNTNEVTIQRKGVNYTITGTVPARGNWKLTVYGGKAPVKGSRYTYARMYWGIVSFHLVY